MKVALVHYWLTGMRGGERVLEAMCEMFPDADIFTHVYEPDSVSPTIRRHRVRTTFVQKLPKAAKWYRNYLGLMPFALEQLDLRDYDLVISSESGPAKGVLVRSGALHVCYCHTPMRYLWDLYHEYQQTGGRLTRLILPPLAHYLRMWDAASAARVDSFVANSAYVAERIRKTYRRTAQVIHPPVEVERFRSDHPREDFYLAVSHMVPYKRTDLLLEAFRGLDKRLIVIGTGPDFKKLQPLAGPNVQLLGWQSDAVVADHLERCKALVFCAEEDFGIVPLEAQAAGAPVIAYGRGGARETVIGGVTGLFFDEQTVESLRACLEQFETAFVPDPNACRSHAERFAKERFMTELRDHLSEQLAPSGRTIGSLPHRQR